VELLEDEHDDADERGAQIVLTHNYHDRLVEALREFAKTCTDCQGTGLVYYRDDTGERRFAQHLENAKPCKFPPCVERRALLAEIDAQGEPTHLSICSIHAGGKCGCGAFAQGGGK
jgi:hypothetical protein